MQNPTPRQIEEHRDYVYVLDKVPVKEIIIPGSVIKLASLNVRDYLRSLLLENQGLINATFSDDEFIVIEPLTNQVFGHKLMAKVVKESPNSCWRIGRMREVLPKLLEMKNG